MGEQLVRCRVRRDGYQVGGEMTAHVDLESGDVDQVMKTILRNAAERDGKREIGKYVLELLDRYGDVTTTYVIAK